MEGVRISVGQEGHHQMVSNWLSPSTARIMVLEVMPASNTEQAPMQPEHEACIQGVHSVPLFVALRKNFGVLALSAYAEYVGRSKRFVSKKLSTTNRRVEG